MNNGYAIASPHTLATDAGWAAFEQGGSAVDAALAAAVTLAVCYPHMCSVGGDLMALLRRPGGEVTSINASGAAPRRVAELGLDGRATVPVTGPASVTVPGVVGGWEALHRAGGKLAFAEAFGRGIDLALEGAPVAGSLALALVEGRDELAADPGLGAHFYPGGRPLAPGETFRQAALGATLQVLARDGAAALYGGPVGARLVAGLQEWGAVLGEDDLAAHHSEVTAPLCGRYGEWSLAVNPPNSQGVALLQVAGAVEAQGLDLDPLGQDAGRIARILHAVAAERDRRLGDPRAGAVPIEAMLDPAHLAALGREPGRASRSGGPRGAVRSGDTVAVVAQDPDGQAVSIVQSVFHAFGAGMLEARTGIIIHNRGALFSLDPRSVNHLQPGKRPLHTLMPVMLSADSGRRAVAGTMGGRAQPQVHTHLLAGIVRGKSPTEVVGAPRWVVGGLDAGSVDDEIFVEGTVPAATRRALEGSGMALRDLPDLDEAVGHAQVIIGEGATVEAAADPRSDGSARVG